MTSDVSAADGERMDRGVLVKRMMAALVVALATTVSVPGHATEQIPTTLTAHPVVLRADGLTAGWFFGEIYTVLIDSRTGDGIGGQKIEYLHGDQVFCTATTQTNGGAACSDPLGEVSTIQAGGYTARFVGTPTYAGSEDSAKLINLAGSDI
jgi:hypothetical protein